MALYNSTIELIGNTPLLRLNNIEKLFNLNAKLYAKLEMFNPAGSIKGEKAMAPHSSTLAWKISWTEEPGRLQSMGSLRVGHD